MISQIQSFLDQDERLAIWPSRPRSKGLVLHYLASKFEYGKTYEEKQINAILNQYHTFQDPALLRRELFGRRFLNRTKDGRKYWKKAYSLLPSQWESERLAITDAQRVEVDELQAVYDALSYTDEWAGPPQESPQQSPILDSLKQGNLPPDGHLELYKLQSVRTKQGDQLIGYLEVYHGYPTEDILYIGGFYLHPTYQNQGYGQEVVRQLMTEVGNLIKYSSIRLSVDLKNWSGLRFWTQIGFDKVIAYNGDKVYSPNSFANLILEYRLPS